MAPPAPHEAGGEPAEDVVRVPGAG